MFLTKFTRNYTDHSADRGYQFEFFCERCGNGFMSELKPSDNFDMAATGLGATVEIAEVLALILGKPRISHHDAHDMEAAVRTIGHNKALRQCIEEAKPHFHQCPKCSHWACLPTCWNAKRMLCFDCAPDIGTELASAQVPATADQVKPNLTVTSGATARCQSCGAPTQGPQFCIQCGQSLHPKDKCGHCGTTLEASVNFCIECGNKIR